MQIMSGFFGGIQGLPKGHLDAEAVVVAGALVVVPGLREVVGPPPPAIHTIFI